MGKKELGFLIKWDKMKLYIWILIELFSFGALITSGILISERMKLFESANIIREEESSESIIFENYEENYPYNYTKNGMLCKSASNISYSIPEETEELREALAYHSVLIYFMGGISLVPIPLMKIIEVIFRGVLMRKHRSLLLSGSKVLCVSITLFLNEGLLGCLSLSFIPLEATYGECIQISEHYILFTSALPYALPCFSLSLCTLLALFSIIFLFRSCSFSQRTSMADYTFSARLFLLFLLYALFLFPANLLTFFSLLYTFILIPYSSHTTYALLIFAYSLLNLCFELTLLIVEGFMWNRYTLHYDDGGPLTDTSMSLDDIQGDDLGDLGPHPISVRFDLIQDPY